MATSLSDYKKERLFLVIQQAVRDAMKSSYSLESVTDCIFHRIRELPFDIDSENRSKMINYLTEEVHKANARWWKDLHTDQPFDRNVGEMLMLMVTELAEAMEGYRKNLMDDKLPHRKMVEVEMADTVIRIFDFCGGLGLDLGGAFVEKMAYNATRHDHTKEGRLAEGGKKC